MLSQLFVLSIFTALLWSILQYFSQRRKFHAITRQHGCQPPLELPRPLFGLFEAVKYIQAFADNKFLPYAQTLFDKNGYTFRETTLFEPVIWTAEPANIRECLTKQFKTFELGYFRRQMALPLLGTGIFTADGSDWVHLRAAMRPSFKKAHIGDLNMFEGHVQNLIKRIPKDGATVDLQELFRDFTMDTTTDFLFGHSAGALIPGNQEAIEFSAAFAVAMRRTIIRSGLGVFMNIIPDKQLRDSCTIVHRYVDKLVGEAISCLPPSSELEFDTGRYVYLHEMSKSTKDPRELRDHAMQILLAGRDTTSSLLAFMFMLLAQHQSIWELLRSEVTTELQGEIPTAESLKGMKYLQMIINEAMRLYPLIPFNLRRATTDTTLPVGGGPSGLDPILVREGDQVCFATWTMHRRKDIWGDDANDFIPTRWEKLTPEMEASFLPFNSGPRVCIGQTFALSETMYTVTRLVQTFGILESRDDRPWAEDVGINLSSANGVLVGIKRTD